MLGTRMLQNLKIAAIFAILVASLSTHSLEIISPIATIKSASTDDSPSASIFELNVQSSVAPTGLTTTTDFLVSLTLRPQAADLTKNASVYIIIVANNQFFKLEPDGSYAPWSGALETLTPFASDQMLASSQTLVLLDGTMAEAGDYLYFAAYSVEGESTLHYTSEPAQISVKASTELPNNIASQAANTFETEIETAVVQARCVACHVEGGLARNSALQFQRTNTASALNNFGSLSAYLKEKGETFFLAKIAGGEGHAGGVQLTESSDGYLAIQRVIAELADAENQTLYAFSQASGGVSSRQASFLTEVTLEPREASLRRAALLLQGRLPTEAERNAADSDAGLREVLRSFMAGAPFREFVITSVNDRLLTEGSDNPLNSAFSHFVKLHNEKARSNLAGENGLVENGVQTALRRTGGELVAYVVENERPYSEILTANYMMMNPILNTWLEGTASFSANDDAQLFKPSTIQGYYYSSALEEVEFRENSNSTFRVVGESVQNFPHAGLLNDFGFISRYPTTATNRNRARARWTFYHFLGIDVEKSSQRPTDEASLSDRNNPTMNNPNCTVCHSLLDPVAGAFQNWDEDNFYRGNERDGLDGFYKHPQDGTKSLYQNDDLWYRDMRDPGLFDKKITERDNTLLALAELIVDEPLFKTASASFWWSPVFGKPLLDKPAVEADNGYAAKLAGYRAQQDAIEGFAESLSKSMNAKDMLVEMFMSPWFSGESVASYTFDSAHFESKFGSEQLLTPEQLARKTRAVTGVAWRTIKHPDGTVYSQYDELSVLLGGIDSAAVTARAIELTPTMTSILMTHATESACIAVARQFATPLVERSLFTMVEETTLPLAAGSSWDTLPSEKQGDWKTLSLAGEIGTGSHTFSLWFANPYCNWTGTECLDQRTLYVDSVAVTSPSGVKQTMRGSDPRLVTSYSNGNPSCYPQSGGYSVCYDGSLSLTMTITEPGRYIFESSLSAELAPSLEGYVEVQLAIQAQGDILKATTKNATAIKEQISILFERLHGTINEANSEQVMQVYEIFAAALTADQESDEWWGFENCAVYEDGLFDEEIYTAEELASFRTVTSGQDQYNVDWDIKGPLQLRITADPLSSKYAWTAVMMYMLSHYDYVHE